MKATAILTISFLVVLAHRASGDSFGSGGNAFDIEFITVGNPNNPPDTHANTTVTGRGLVDHTYRIAKYEISAGMIDKANAVSQVAGAPLGITQAAVSSPDKAAYFISWLEAARFVNWLNTSTGYVAAYKFDAGGGFFVWSPGDFGYDPTNQYRNSFAKYFLPTDSEWYKAAFYDPKSATYFSYPTGSDSAPTPVTGGTAEGTAVYAQAQDLGSVDSTAAGGLSPFGTMAQGGNVWEYMESVANISSVRRARGGDWNDTAASVRASVVPPQSAPNTENLTVGIRVASTFVPEPPTALLALSCFTVVGMCRRKPSLHARD
jgi:formylglycine-generating enzyme